MNDKLITEAEKLLSELIDEAKRMDAYIKDDNKRENYRELKQRQLGVLEQMIEELKNQEQPETIYLHIPQKNTNFDILPEQKIENISEMSLRKIRGMYGKEQARAESIRRAEELMEYQETKYSLTSKQ